MLCKDGAMGTHAITVEPGDLSVGDLVESMEISDDGATVTTTFRSDLTPAERARLDEFLSYYAAASVHM